MQIDYDIINSLKIKLRLEKYANFNQILLLNTLLKPKHNIISFYTDF